MRNWAPASYSTGRLANKHTNTGMNRSPMARMGLSKRV